MPVEIFIPQKEIAREVRRLNRLVFRGECGAVGRSETDKSVLMRFEEKRLGTIEIEIPLQGKRHQAVSKLHCTDSQLRKLKQHGFSFEYPLRLFV